MKDSAFSEKRSRLFCRERHRKVKIPFLTLVKRAILPARKGETRV